MFRLMDIIFDPTLLVFSYIMIFTGELIEKEEAKLLGEILYKTDSYTDSDFTNAEELAQFVIEEKLTYEIFELAINKTSAEQFLSLNLKDMLKSSEFSNCEIVSCSEIWLV